MTESVSSQTVAATADVPAHALNSAQPAAGALDTVELSMEESPMESASKRQKNVDEMFCPSCCEIIKREAVICVRCGISLPAYLAPTTWRSQQPASMDVLPRSKGIAVVMAVFLGFWSWLYTFRRNHIKFFVGLGCQIIALIAFVMGGSNSSYNDGLPLVIIILSLAATIGIWLWAVIDNASKPSQYFSENTKQGHT